MFNRLVVAVLIFSFSSLVHAESFFDKLTSQKPGNMNYRYLSVSYVDYDEIGDGLGFLASIEIKKNIAANIYYDTVSEGSIDGTVLGFDALIHRELSDATDTDLFYGVGFRRISVDAGSFGNASESGLVFTLGGRKELDPDLEINAKVAFETVDDTDIEFGIGGVYEISDLLHFQADLLFADGDRLGLGVRYYLN